MHVVQSAPGHGLTVLEQGKTPPALHFAQVNERDGFFLAGRAPDRAFFCDQLRGKRILVDHGMQPMGMFKYPFEGEFVHLQGLASRELQHKGPGHVVAALGDAFGPCASSLAATRKWLATDKGKRFMATYRRARAWLIETPTAEVPVEASFFPTCRPTVLTATIAT